MSKELKRFDIVGKYRDEETMYEYRPDGECYDADEVDALLAEKDKEIAELKAKLEDAKATAYAESVDAGMRERRLRRALYLAHAYKAKFKRWWLHLAHDCEASMIRPDTKTINRIRRKIGNCEKSERKCREKAEEYK